MGPTHGKPLPSIRVSLVSEDLFFVTRNGCVWACWLSGKPAVNLGNADEAREAMRQFVGPPEGEVKEPAAPAPPPAPPPHPGRASASAPPPPPPPRQIVDRLEPRHDITIFGRIYTTVGSREVVVLDLSERGCRFNDATGSLRVGVPLSIKLGAVGPVEAEVKWRKDDSVGVAFRTPLYPSVMAHIRDSFDLRR